MVPAPIRAPRGAATFVVTLFVPLTSQAGEALAERLPEARRDPDARRRRQAVGDLGRGVRGMHAAVVLLDVVRRGTAPDLTGAESRAVAWLPSECARGPPDGPTPRSASFQVLAVLASIGVLVMVIRAGHTGAQAVWLAVPRPAARLSESKVRA